MSYSAEDWAESAAAEHLKMAQQAREEADRIRTFRDYWIEAGRPEGSTMYMHSRYENDDGAAAIEASESAAEHHERRAREVYQETLERIRRQEEAEEEDRRREEGQQKADEILDDWFDDKR